MRKTYTLAGILCVAVVFCPLFAEELKPPARVIELVQDGDEDFQKLVEEYLKRQAEEDVPDVRRERVDEAPVISPEFDISPDDFDSFGFDEGLEAPEDEQPSVPLAPQIEAPSISAPEPLAAQATRGADFGSPQTQSQIEPTATASPSAEVVSGSEQAALNSNTVGGLLQDSSNVQTVSTQRRSPISLDPRVRGFHLGQLHTESLTELLFPARQDLDTLLSKLEPAFVDEILVIPGPYATRYGPAHSFIDVRTAATPRNRCPDSQLTESITYHTNGNRVNSRTTVQGGAKDWGYRLNYGYRNGVDYQAGNGAFIPASYKNQIVLGQFGFDINRDLSLEFRFNRLDQTDTEYAGQFFDIRHLGANSLNFRLNYEGIYFWDRITTSAWYNDTNFAGDIDDKIRDSRPAFPVIERVQNVLAAPISSAGTNGRLRVAGGRLELFRENNRQRTIRLGADARYLGQRLFEELFSTAFEGGEIRTNLPGSRYFNPGVFAEFGRPIRRRWNLTAGVRVDGIFARANSAELKRDSMGALDSNLNPDDLDDDDILYSFFLSNEFEMTQFTTLKFGFGHSQRPPTLIERYADGIFLGLNQSGLTRVIGSPDLRHERNWQFDWGINVDRQRYRVRANSFFSWIQDYVTYAGNNVVLGLEEQARLLRFVNTDLAFLSGFEVYGDYDVNPFVTAFGTLQYVHGDDLTMRLSNGDVEQRPLFGIAPLEGRLGLRFHDQTGGDVWQVETAARIVNDQDQVGFFREGNSAIATQVVPLESKTPGFTTFYLRGYLNVARRLRLVGGVENIFDQSYIEHLDLRYPAGAGFDQTRVLSPGRSIYFGTEWSL